MRAWMRRWLGVEDLEGQIAATRGGSDWSMREAVEQLYAFRDMHAGKVVDLSASAIDVKRRIDALESAARLLNERLDATERFLFQPLLEPKKKPTPRKKAKR